MIPKEKVIERIKAQLAICHEIDSDWCSLTAGTCKRILDLLDEKQEDPDVVRVVRCKDCLNYERWPQMEPMIGLCRFLHQVKPGEFYCGNGEKKRKRR